MKTLIPVLLLVVLALSPVSASEELADTVIEIYPYDREGVNGATHPFLVWYLFNQSLHGEDLIMDVAVTVLKADVEFDLYIRFEKMWVVVNQGGGRAISWASVTEKVPRMTEGDTTRKSILWNKDFSPSRVEGQPPFTTFYFESVRIILERPFEWNGHVTLQVKISVSNQSAVKENDGVSSPETTRMASIEAVFSRYSMMAVGTVLYATLRRKFS